MKVVFWGTRGSLPAALNANGVRQKVRRALTESVGKLQKKSDVDGFLDSLPFILRGTYGANTSCVEISGTNERVICDAGTGLRDLGNQAMTDQSGCKVFNIIISHCHWDHIQGFPFFIPAYVPGNTINIYGCHQDLEQAFRDQMRGPHFPVNFNDLGSDISFIAMTPDETSRIAGLDVTPIKQSHPGDSYGYRFDSEGKSVVYATDCEHREDATQKDYPILNLYRNSDLLIFDAQYGFGDAVTSKLDWGHSSNIIGVELAKEAGVGCLCLFHQDPSMDDEALDEYLDQTRQYARLYRDDVNLDVIMSYDGLTLEI